MARRKNVKYMHNINLPATKLRNIFCVQCKHQFLLQEFVPLNGIIPLLLNCGHVICDKCTKSLFNKPCPSCNLIIQYENDQTYSLPINIYALGLTVMSHNRAINTDDSDITFSKLVNQKSKQQSIKGLCQECGIQAAVKCQQCIALFCHICYSKIHGRALQSHTKIILSAGNNENSFTIRNTCSERCNEPLGYYCENCEIAGCSHCMLRLHKTHNYQPLQKKNQELLPEFHKVFKRVSENFQRIQLAQKKLKTKALYPSEMQNTDNVEANVTQHFCYLHGVLQNLERKIIDSLRERQGSRSKNIDEISMQLMGHEERLQSALMITSSVTENLDKVDIQQVIQKLKPLADIPCHLVQNIVPDEKENIKFEFDMGIIEAMEKHCSISIPETSSYILQRTDLLPDNYEIKPLTEEFNASKCKYSRSTRNKPTSFVVSVPPKIDNHPNVGSSEMVRVSHVIDPSFFFVQLVQNQHKISELNEGLATLVNTTGTIPTEVTLNALYVVQYFKDKLWYRARVINKRANPTDGEKYNVVFIDYGMQEENVPLQRIRNIVPQFAMIPTMALKCTLYDIVPNEGVWHPDATQAFKNLVCINSMVSMYIMMITGDTYYVDLCVISSKDSGLISVKDSLTYMKYATCISQNKLMRMNPDSIRKYYKEQLEMETYTDVQILFVQSPSSIYVQKTHANRSYFNQMVRDMTAEYERNAYFPELIAAPIKDMPCAARGVNGLWYRGLISEVTETVVKVFYVDLGYTLILNHDAIRTLHRKYMTCKTQTIKISLRNIRPPSGDRNQWDSDTNEFIKKLLMDTKNFRVMAFGKSGDTYSVVMYSYDKTNIANLLVNNGLAISVGSSFHNTSMNSKPKNKKSKFIKSASLMELPHEYDDPMDLTIKNKSIDESEDPFKICVLIHQVQSPDCIYVSDATSNQSDVEKVMSQMQEFYNKYRSAKRDVWSKDSACAVYSEKSNMYYRGRINDVKSPDKAVVFLYDLGIEETVPISCIQSLYPMFSKVSTYIFKIKLNGILPCGGSSTWPSLSCEQLREIIDNNQHCKFYISKLEEEDVENCAIPVELWIKQVKMDGPLAPTRYEINSVNRMLVEHGVALPVKEYAKKRDKILAIELKRQLIKKLERLAKAESNVKWFEISNNVNDSIEACFINQAAKMSRHPNSGSNSDSDLDSDSDSDSNIPKYDVEKMLDNIPSLPKLSTWLAVKPIMEDTFIAIPTYLDHDGFLYLHSKVENAKILQYIEHKLENLYKICSFESCDTVWAKEDMCIAQYHANKKWYRGEVVNVQEHDIVEVKFVDYGNVEECVIGTLKKKVVLEDIPIQCTKCSVYNLNPGNANGKWLTEDLDKIHSLIIEQECEVTIIDRTEPIPVISLTMLPNNYCNKKIDLIQFLINEWKMNINLNDESESSENSISIANNTTEVVAEISRSLSLEYEETQEPIISGNSAILPHTDAENKNGSSSTTTIDVANLSWCKIKDEVATSSPYVASEENLSMSYKLVDIPEDIDYIEIELCCSINLTTFYAQLKENKHSSILNSYYTQYKLLMNDLQENGCKQPMITTLATNTLCCAKFNDDLWYRCLVTEVKPIEDSGDVNIELFYVDYGNDEYRTINPQKSELYTLKKEWLDVPGMAIKCQLWNVEVASSRYNELLIPLSEMYNKRVIATIKKTDEEFISVELYENQECKEVMYNALIEEGLFKVVSEENRQIT